MPQASAVKDRAVDDGTIVYGSIVKYEDTPEGHLMVFGKATGTDLDGDGQRMSSKFLAKAMPEWMEWGNLREQHSKIAAGVGVELARTDDDSWTLKSLCVDEGTKAKIKAGVLKGYSINVLGARVTQGTPAAPNGEIVDGVIGEISYVDRPCLGSATISICKALGDEHKLEVADAPTEEELDELDDSEATPLVDDAGADGDDDDLAADIAALDDRVDGVAKSIGELTTLVKTLAKAAPAVVPAPAAQDDTKLIASLTKALGGSADGGTVEELAKTIGATISDQITTAVSKAQAESDVKHEAEIASLRGTLEKVLATPVPGAPIIMGAPRHQSEANPAGSRRTDLLNKAARRDLSPEAAAAYRMAAGMEPETA